MSGTTRTVGPLHFEDLEPHRFEDLVRQLIYDFRAWRALEATGRAGSDDGFDARGFEIGDLADVATIEESDEDEATSQTANDRLWLVQCKREQKVTPARIQKHLDAIPAESTDGIYGVIFVAACDFSKKTRDVFRAWCRNKGIGEAHLWGKAELEDQLYQPKNDGLLFAYFGFSLRIRRRSVKTELRARLAMKRKAERILQPYQAVLLRDPTDDRYPWVDDGGRPGQWRIAKFLDHHPKGIMLETRRYFAYLSDDQDQWDYVEKSEHIAVSQHENPWHETTEDSSEDKYDEIDRIYKYCSNLPRRNQANYILFELIRYEEILDIDEKGDVMATVPHIYLETVSARQERCFLENLERFNPVRI